MNQKRVSLIKEYIQDIETLENDNFFDENYINSVVDLIHEIFGVFKLDLPGIDEDLVLNNNTLERDLRIIKNRLKIVLSDVGELAEDKESLNYDLFWNSFISWFEKESVFSHFLKDDFTITIQVGMGELTL